MQNIYDVIFPTPPPNYYTPIELGLLKEEIVHLPTELGINNTMVKIRRAKFRISCSTLNILNLPVVTAP